MCDYSLNGVPNRLAVEGERLIAYRFPNGVMGFVSQSDLAAFSGIHTTFWNRLCAWFRSETPCAVCLPPGATLIVRDVPDWLQAGFPSEKDEVVKFTSSGSPYEYRDGIQFRWGTKVLLQQLIPGQVADVLSLEHVETAEHVGRVRAMPDR